MLFTITFRFITGESSTGTATFASSGAASDWAIGCLNFTARLLLCEVSPA